MDVLLQARVTGEARGWARGSGAQKAGEGRLDRGVPVGRPDGPAADTALLPSSRKQTGRRRRRQGQQAPLGPAHFPDQSQFSEMEPTEEAAGCVVCTYQALFRAGPAGPGGKRSPGRQWAPVYPGIWLEFIHVRWPLEQPPHWVPGLLVGAEKAKQKPLKRPRPAWDSHEKELLIPGEVAGTT